MIANVTRETNYRGLIAAGILALIVILLPVEHRLDKMFRFFSLTLIPDGITPSPHFDKKITFYLTDFLILSLLFLKVPIRSFFSNPLWITFLSALVSIIASPYFAYPLPYFHLIHLFTAIALVSFLITSLNDKERSLATKAILIALTTMGLFESLIGIIQYFHEAPLGLKFLSEPTQIQAQIAVPNEKLWLFDWPASNPTALKMRATGTLPHPNPYGGFLFVSIFSLFALYTLKPKKMLLLLLPILIFALFLSYSRAALLALLLSSLLFFTLQRIRPLIITTILSIALSSLLLFSQLTARNEFGRTFPADQTRIYYQNISLLIIKDKPLFGLGYTQYFEHVRPYLKAGPTEFTAPHNIFLLLATETGLLSLLAFLLFLTQTLLRFFKTPLNSALLSLTLGLLLLSCCDFYPLFSQPGRLLFFLPLALLASHFKSHEIIEIN